MQALHDIVQAGLARYIGMSSCHAYQFQQMQSEYNGLERGSQIRGLSSVLAAAQFCTDPAPQNTPRDSRLN